MASPALSPALLSREQLWDASFETYYDAYFEELVAYVLAIRWQRFNDFTKVIVAATASGSVLSGWALWGDPRFKIIWFLCSGVAAVVSLIFTTLNVEKRIEALSDSWRRFINLRMNLESFRLSLQAEPFDAEKLNQEYMDFRKKFIESVSLLKQFETFRTKKVIIAAQLELNKMIEDQIEEGGNNG